MKRCACQIGISSPCTGCGGLDTAVAVVSRPQKPAPVLGGKPLGGKPPRCRPAASANGAGAYKSGTHRLGDDPLPICPPFPPLVLEAYVPPVPREPARLPPRNWKPNVEIPRPQGGKPALAIRPRCTIRLAAEMAPDRKGGHWWLRSDGCGRFESWLAHSLDVFSTSRTVLDRDTYRRVRRMNPDFVGLIVCMPTGLHVGQYLRIPGPELNELRDTGGFLVTDAPLSTWAIEVDNSWRLGPRLAGRDDTLPYLPYFNQSSGKGMILAPNAGERPAGFPADEALRITCHPTVFAVDPSRAAGVMAAAILATCREYGADGVRLDEMTVEYQWLGSKEGEPVVPDLPNDLVRLDSPVLEDCNPAESLAGPLGNGRTQAVKFGDGHFSLSPYTRFHPAVCGGRGTRGRAPGAGVPSSGAGRESCRARRPQDRARGAWQRRSGS